ncbi:MAG: sulfatase-like hydrolase/transferase [Alphaproteobacteria bacterium]|nr:sulfatase-like hydrolase/transferase [Alphaproteobacteria bacterium]
MRRTVLLSVALLLALVGLAAQLRLIDPLRPLYTAAPTRPTVVFVVLDTVRADRLSLCGYDKPTSPTLQRLAAEGASFTCRAYAPGSWTLPSHASYFTGLDLAEHGAHPVPEGVQVTATAELVRPLDERHPTLAERLAARGYQTVALSANPVLSKASGLLRGFERSRAPEAFGPLHGRGFGEALRQVLRGGVDPERPLFLFVNIADAHQPWAPIPDDLGWLPPREGLLWEVGGEEDLWARFFKDELPAAEREALLTQLSDVYDHGVYRADQNLNLLLEQLDDYGWLSGGYRLVVTSDHGELLGEHGLIDHGHYLWEGNNRVPLLVWEAGRSWALPEPVSARVVHDLVLDGALPEPLPEVSAAAFPHPFRHERTGGRAFGDTSLALWSGEEKRLRVNGEDQLYQLDEDPGERAPRALEDAAALDAWAARVQASVEREGGLSPALQEALRAAGYMD